MIRSLSLLAVFIFLCSSSLLEARGGGRGGRGHGGMHPNYRHVERNVHFGYPGGYGGDYEAVDPYLYPEEEYPPQVE